MGEVEKFFFIIDFNVGGYVYIIFFVSLIRYLDFMLGVMFSG